MAESGILPISFRQVDEKRQDFVKDLTKFAAGDRLPLTWGEKVSIIGQVKKERICLLKFRQFVASLSYLY